MAPCVSCLRADATMCMCVLCSTEPAPVLAEQLASFVTSAAERKSYGAKAKYARVLSSFIGHTRLVLLCSPLCLFVQHILCLI